MTSSELKNRIMEAQSRNKCGAQGNIGNCSRSIEHRHFSFADITNQ